MITDSWWIQLLHPPPFHCPTCGIVPNLYKHCKKEQLFFDLPMRAKRVGLIIKRQRYRCRECEETFFEDLPDIDASRSVTNRLIEWIQLASLEKIRKANREKVSAKERRQLMRDRY